MATQKESGGNSALPSPEAALARETLEVRLNRAVKAVSDAERQLRAARVAERNARKDLAEAGDLG